jgi:hypothetical protein
MSAESGHAASRVYIGQDGHLHLNGAKVYDGSETDITSTLNLSGDVTATPTELNTLAGVTAGTVSASKAVVVDSNGQISGLKKKVTAASADGAITIADGIVKITKSSAAALTLADPSSGQEGTRILITAQTAQAHTVSNAAGSGFNAGGSASDVATFGGAIGDSIDIVAINAKWNVVSATNVTLG